MKYYLGIDPSLTGCAVAIVGEKGEFINSQRFSNKLRGMERLIFIRNKVAEVLNDYNWRHGIKAVGIEGYARGAMNRREEAGELGGTLRILLFENKIQYIDIAPSQIKKFATGKGNAQKDHVLLAVYKKWGIEFKTNDEADAFVAAQVVRAMFEDADGALVYEKEVLKKLKTGA
jgi:crossover junction endodeoxyribonuclease RuvC